MKKIILTSVILLLSFTMVQIAHSYSGGNGTSGDPYLISNASDLTYLSIHNGDWSKHFKQTANITLSGSFSPIGNLTIKFTGSYDGDGHTISGLYISSSSDYCGLFGHTYNANIIDLGLTDVNISAGGYTDGLVGYNYGGTVINCYSTGSVSGDERVGGLVGYNYGFLVSNCYSTGSVSGDERVGGLVGNNAGIVSNCYSTGSVSGDERVGGLVGSNNVGTVSNSFWDYETSGLYTSPGGECRSTDSMKTQTTFTSAGWDFDVDGISAGHNGVWIMAGYPHLQIEWTTTISDVIGLQMVSLDLDEDYTLSCNIDASATSTWNYNGSTYEGFSPIGNLTKNFTGSYDGDGHTISGLYISSSSDYCGLFGYTYNANIIDLGLTDVNISAGGYTGGLVGMNFFNSTVTDCYSTGSVNGTDKVGGLVGNNKTGSTVSNCYSTCSVNGNSRVGGLVGLIYYGDTVSNCYSTGSVNGNDKVGGLVGYNNHGPVSNCYSTGSVTGTDYVGGLAGSNAGTVSNCYSTGSVSGTDYVGGLVGSNNVGTVSNSFWDTQTSGQSTSSGGTGYNTTGMQTDTTFINAGWSPSIWYMDPGAEFNDGYPYLHWQNPGGTPLPVELSSFTASVNKNDVTLKWTTEWEINNAGFDIERQSLSVKKDIWTKIGFVEGNETTNEPKHYTFRDRKLKSGKYNYRLVQRDYNNRGFEHFLTDIVTIGVPKKYAISQNYPNPFNPMTKIDYELPYDGKVNIVLYDITGRKIATLVNEVHIAGYYTAEFNASHLASGVYFYRIIAKGGENDFIITKKMLMIK